MTDGTGTTTPRASGSTPATTIRQKVSDRVAALDPNLTPERVAEKMANARLWWGRVGKAAAIALVFIVLDVGLIAKMGKDTPVPILIALGVPVGLCALAVLYCANQADGEATKEFINEVKDLRHAIPFLGGHDG